MTTQKQNELLTLIGPGAAMGELFRRYWLPALLAEELPEPDCPPVRVKLLSERLLAFRDSDGKLGLIDEFCAHRGVSLWFGRNEESGLRCPYHGWKYDTSGQCIEVPSEPAASGYCQKIKLTSYPLIERGGVLWTYMGPPELQPAPPEFEFAMVGPKHRFVSKRLQESNWLQAMEGGIDSSHSAFLHRGEMGKDPLFKTADKSKQYSLEDFQVKFEVVESEGGLLIGSRRKADNGNFYWRIAQWVMPCFTAIAPHGNNSIHGHFWVPIDDENCWAWSYNYHPTRELTDEEMQLMKAGYGVHVKLIPGTYIPVGNKSNDYLMDRASQKAGITYSGVDGIAIQDASLQESMGGIQDRTKENLVSTDNGVIMTRHRLSKAALALQQKGVQPPGVDPSAHRVRPAGVVLPPDVSFKEGAKEALVAQTSLAPAWV
jgi:phenylpropionate dioxygenase-like ring-hydroxylating dioxygenase large terminal subunit